MRRNGVLLAMLGLAWTAVDGSAQSPQFRGDATHRGTVETRGAERLGGVAWRFPTGGAIRSSPALEDGTLYIGSGDGLLYAIDAGTGALRWTFDAGSPIASSPAVTGNVVLVGSRDGVLNAVDAGNGDRIWSVETGPDLPLPWGHEGWDYIQSSPSVSGGVAYWGSGDGGVRAIDVATGRLIWHFDTGARVRSTPALSDGLLVVGSSDGFVYALDAATGTERWRFETDGVTLVSAEYGFDRVQVSASATISGDEIFIGGRDATLYALNASDGSVRWRFDESSSWVISTTAVDDTRVFSARSSSGNIRAIDRDSGDELWAYEAGAFVYSSGVLAGNVLYVGQGDGDFTALDADTGEELWSYDTGGAVYSTPVVHDGRVFFGSDDGYVYALSGTEGPGWRRAVYFDEARSGASLLGSAPAHASIRDYFANRGFETLDGDGLEAFMGARMADGAASVIVFAMDGVPDGLTTAPDGETPLMRRYLDAGGKVVWMSYPPAFLVRDPETGGVIGTDIDATSALLDVDFSARDGDDYSTHPTDQGREWGLESWWVGVGEATRDAVTEPLAVDELGRAVAWVKNFGGPRGTGFVQTRISLDHNVLRQIRLVAEFGLANADRGR